MTQDSMYIALRADHAVRHVARNSTKTSQGNVGNHYMEQNLLVYMAGFQKPVEFELTRNQHMKPAPGRSHTVTACFKQPPTGMEAVAWQVLLRITKGKELLPQWVQQYARRSLARISPDAAAGPPTAPQAPPQVATSGPGSASPPTQALPGTLRACCWRALRTICA